MAATPPHSGRYPYRARPAPEPLARLVARIVPERSAFRTGEAVIRYA
jgi:hypothetical protein